MNVITEISQNDGMFEGNSEHYFHVGESAIQSIHSAISDSGKKTEDIKNILDLPCGHGRVLRFLKADFPDARITACDLDKDGVDFCTKTFGAIPVYSSNILSEISLERNFDLIWVGSLLTHLDLNNWYKFFKFFSEKLNPDGLLIVSFHGPYLFQRILENEKFYSLTSEGLISLQKQYEKNQFGYVNYPQQTDYGVSVSAPLNTFRVLKKFPELEIISYTAKAWDEHHDVICCKKNSIGYANKIGSRNSFINRVRSFFSKT